MAKSRRYASGNRRQMVELVRTCRTVEELSREFECSAHPIRNWVRQADLDEGLPGGRSDDVPSATSLRRLRSGEPAAARGSGRF